MKKNLKKVLIYTDGACSNNPGVGGWGAILIYNNHTKEISGFQDNTTNNQMELLAVIKAVESLKEECDITIHSDSAYVCNAFINNWITDWQNNDWKTSTNKPVKNIELWKELLSLLEKHKYKFLKVKGHSDNEFNNRCDKLATDSIKKQMK